MPISALPEELLHRILSTHFARVPEAFCGDPTENLEWSKQRRARRQVPVVPPCDALLVSKQWLRVGTPLLYRFLSISSPEHAQRIAALFRANPGLGNAVRHVRLRGGYGKDLKTILCAAPNVQSFSVTLLKLQSKDSVAGLRSVIPKLNPSMLYVDFPWRLNKNRKEIIAVLVTAIGTQWTSLKRVNLFQCSEGPKEVIAAMRASPSLEEVSINQRDVDQWMAMGLVKGLADKKKLLYRGTITQESIERTCEIFRIPKCVADLLLPAEEIPEEAWMDQPMHIPGEDERDFDGWFFDDDDDELP